MKKLLTFLCICGLATSCFADQPKVTTLSEAKEIHSQLVVSVCTNDLSGIKINLGYGASPNAADETLIYMLPLATTCGSKDAFKYLLEAGASPNLRLPSGLTPVLMAAEHPDPFYLETLLAFDGNLNAVNRGLTETALNVAFQHGRHTGNWDNYELLLDRGADINFVPRHATSVALQAMTFGKACRSLQLVEMGASKQLGDLLVRASNKPYPKSPEDEKCRLELVDLLETKFAADATE